MRIICDGCVVDSASDRLHQSPFEVANPGGSAQRSGKRDRALARCECPPEPLKVQTQQRVHVLFRLRGRIVVGVVAAAAWLLECSTAILAAASCSRQLMREQAPGCLLLTLRRRHGRRGRRKQAYRGSVAMPATWFGGCNVSNLKSSVNWPVTQNRYFFHYSNFVSNEPNSPAVHQMLTLKSARTGLPMGDSHFLTQTRGVVPLSHRAGGSAGLRRWVIAIAKLLLCGGEGQVHTIKTKTNS